MSKETLAPSFKIVEVAEPPKPVKTTQYFVFDDYIKLHEQIILDDYKYAKPATFHRELTDFKPTIISGIRYFQLHYGFGSTPYLLTEQGYKHMLSHITPRYFAEMDNEGNTLITPSFASKQDVVSYLGLSVRSEIKVLERKYLNRIEKLKAQIEAEKKQLDNLKNINWLGSLVKMEFYVSVYKDEPTLAAINKWEDIKDKETRDDRRY